MKINNKTEYDNIKHFSIVRLTQIYILSNKLKGFLANEIVELSDSINKINKNPILRLPDLMEIAKKEGYKTFGDYQVLGKKDPKRVKLIFEQNSLQQSKLWTQIQKDLHSNLFPHITWSSLFLISISHLEYSFISICSFFKDELDIKITLNDISGHSSYDKFTTYCKKVLRFEYNFNNSENWVKIKNHQKVRNLIIHNNGNLDGSQRANTVKQIIDNNQINLSYNEHQNIIITTEYLEDVITDIQNWQLEFFDNIE